VTGLKVKPACVEKGSLVDAVLALLGLLLPMKGFVRWTVVDEVLGLAVGCC